MVRFKAGGVTRRVEQAGGFHPTMVRFKEAGPQEGHYRVISFHPTMVRFKVAWRSSRWSSSTGFHPTMVRFKVIEARQHGGPIQVSIPLWCDLKFGIDITEGQAAQFPSHYGAI